MMMFHPQIILNFILIVVALQGKSFSHARPVKEVTVATTSAMEEGSVGSFSLQKEILPNVNVEAPVRKMSNNKKKKVSIVVGKRKSSELGLKWKDSFKALSADYRSPKSHPPKNN